MIRLDKLLADMELGTRGELKKDIRKGLVSVNGAAVKDPGLLLDGTEDILFKGEKVHYEEFVYYMLNKPAGVISATEDQTQKTVLSLIRENRRKDVFPVGRLDKDTEGLLLLTNDGEMAHRLLSPRRHVDKTYYVKTDGPVTEEDVQLFADGIALSEDFTTLPAELVIRGSDTDFEAEVTIREGKYHQIKRMFHAVGKEVLYLKRISMGPLVLDPELRPGEYRRLTEEEIRALKEV